MLGQDDSCAQACAVRAVVAFSNAIESIARRDDPSIAGAAVEIFAKVLEDGRIVGRYGGEVIECFVDAGGEAGRGHIMAENSLVDDLRVESRLRKQRFDEVGNVLLAFGGKCLFIARTSAEGDYHGFGLRNARRCMPRTRRKAEERAGRDTRSGAQELSSA